MKKNSNAFFAEFIKKEAPAVHLLTFFTMIYMMIMICNGVLTNRYVGYTNFFVLGGTLTCPFFFILGDIIAELFGYNISKRIIIYGFLFETLFSIICQLIIHAPTPKFAHNQGAFNIVLGPMLQIDLGSLTAYLIGSIINVRCLTYWKRLVNGRRFWLRSICSSMISELLYTTIAIIMMEFNRLTFNELIHIIIISFSIKLTYTLIFTGPANLLVNYLKAHSGTDVFDGPKHFLRFKLSKEKSAC